MAKLTLIEVALFYINMQEIIVAIIAIAASVYLIYKFRSKSAGCDKCSSGPQKSGQKKTT
ncbi:MAG TPA: FeoB-associated Cys-rich membrane protein [Bacteroidia bacterium]|nr:FeoB-associated Cys-rich membrane protein [Bacteroidia bacterium]QQR94852.1 MAG: FeoB-associated Cys-rich membrane protein [Bacteroidota bacterium]MBP7715360.1 FeoB-associated Cys-rich membrane protein [Bacteroidia bacterium]HOZ81501.1 FeoB-associated Cys-rich membrane protein [Bacteroidia bacterium]HOZ91496.1 FeoB-associated Cys-rich membrane protein [Bacteroidia bacterium]